VASAKRLRAGNHAGDLAVNKLCISPDYSARRRVKLKPVLFGST
jgi:hypothetical protein